MKKSRLCSLFIAIILAISCVATFTACGNKDPEPSKTTVASISVNADKAKTVFEFGETFTAEGLVVTATMSDNTTKNVELSDCRINEPVMTMVGTRNVTVVYEAKTARYQITIKQKEIPAISQTSLVDITSVNDSVPYRVEAENIDMVTPGVKKAPGIENFIATAPEGSEITSGGKYLTGFNVIWNYFGFTFNASEKYENVTLVFRVANKNATSISADSVKAYLNFAQDETGTASGEISLENYVIQPGVCQWSDIVIRGITIPQGTNTLTFEVQGDTAFDLDYVDFYVGMRYISSVVEISEKTTIRKEFEDFDTEKAFTRVDVANAHGLKDGELFIEAATKESAGKTTSGGMAVGAVGKGSQVSTTLRLAQDASVVIKMVATKTGSYFVKDNWKFSIDGIELKLCETLDINGGNPSTGEWWDWFSTSVGEYNIPAGDHFFLVEAIGADCNLDTIDFEIVSIGEYSETGADLDAQTPDPEPIPEGNGIVIKNDATTGTSYKLEAEDLDLSTLIPQAGFSTPVTESFTGGKGLGGIGGGYQSFTVKSEKDINVAIKIAFAKNEGGSILNYVKNVKVNGKALTLSDGTISQGTTENPYWNVTNVQLAVVKIKANTVYEFSVYVNSGNLDGYVIEVVDEEGVEVPDVTPTVIADVTIASEGVTKCEMEQLDFSKSSIVTRADFIGAVGEGNCGVGGSAIYGFDNGTTFRFDIEVSSACELKVSLAGKGGEALSNYSFKLNNTTITPEAGVQLPSDPMGEVVLGNVQLSGAGIYRFEFTFGVNSDLDYVAFEVVSK